MKSLMFAALFLATAVVAVPIGKDDDGVDTATDVESYLAKTQLTENGVVDVSELINDMVRLHKSASDVIEQVETTISTLESMIPHSIKKRQTEVSGSVDRDNARIDVSHTRGGTTYSGNISDGRGGTSYGAGVSHTSGNTNWGANVQHGRGGTDYGASLSHTSGNTNWGANVQHGRGGTDYEANFGRTWNNGQTSFGANIGHSGSQGTFGGIKFTHKF
ncbi:hypothetical protein PoB_007319400 [Plakobranchus ocellatus]|uniref:Attacin C-terminal domain-containing protein n=1 Tax=Plakobranchus ocellatus TaxID=259542 RepID=A0AAV4DR69_9GAST|nr:hypothetical protein PoB_007319400 [Plakobranchus ocellatus]